MQKILSPILNAFLLILCLPFLCIALENSQNTTTSLEEMYEHHCKTGSSIYEHLPILRQLASECGSVVEIGVNPVISIWGILQGLADSSEQKRNYLGIDITIPPANKLNLANKLAKENGINFTFWHVNDLHIELEPIDMLFIDYLHTYCHLTYELEKFAPKARKYICMHDTSPLWSHKDDDNYKGNYSEYPQKYDRNKKGLWPAIEDFLTNHPEWSLLEHHTNNHGFTILQRNNKDNTSIWEFPDDPNVDYFLKNKIILCTGPSLNRYKMLKNTVEADMNLIPFKKIFVATNDPKIINITFNETKPICDLIKCSGTNVSAKHLDCLNCIISTIKKAINDPDVEDDDIILFKHESVFINDMHLIKQAISKLLNGHNMVLRYLPVLDVYGTDVFYAKVSAMKKILINISILKNLNKTNCEGYFTKHIVRKVPKIYFVKMNCPRFCHHWWDHTELGFYHIPKPKESSIWRKWDKKDYHEIFK